MQPDDNVGDGGSGSEAGATASIEFRELLKALVPVAMDVLRRQFGLIELHGGDELAAEGALLSAWTSFQRRYSEGEFEEIRSREELAGHLVRIAYNRWQRRDRQQKRISREVGQGLGSPEPMTGILNAPDPLPTPPQQFDEQLFREFFWRAVDETISGLTVRERKTVTAWLEDFLSSQSRQLRDVDLAEQLGVSQPTVSRHRAKFLERLRELLAQHRNDD